MPRRTKVVTACSSPRRAAVSTLATRASGVAALQGQTYPASRTAVWRCRPGLALVNCADAREREAVMDDILIRGGQVIDGTGAPARVADVAIRAGRIVAIEADRADSADRVIDAHGCSGGPGLHRHPYPFRLHPAAQPEGRGQDPPGGDDRGGRQLRLLRRAGTARQGRRAARVSVGQRPLADVRGNRLCPLHGQLARHRGEHRDAGRPQHAAPDGDGHGKPRAAARRSCATCRTCWRRGWRPARSACRPACSPRRAASASATSCAPSVAS